MVKIKSLLLSFALVLMAFVSEATEYTKSYDKSFNIEQGALLEVDCSFANVNIDNHNADKIDIHIDVIVKSGSEDKAEKIFERIAVKLIGSPSKVEVITELGKNSMNNVSFEIKINIKAPSHIRLDADVDFGNIDIATIKGRSIINNQYGNLFAEELGGNESNVEVGFGNGHIEKFNGGKVKVDFGNLRIEDLRGDAEVSNSYGNVGLDHVNASCKNLKVDSEFGDADIVLDANGSFDITASSSMGDIDWSKEINTVREKNDWTSTKFEGKMGSGSGKLILTSSFGDMKVKVR